MKREYKKETDADVKGRILLIRWIRIDDQEASKVAEKENHIGQGGGGSISG